MTMKLFSLKQELLTLITSFSFVFFSSATISKIDENDIHKKVNSDSIKQIFSYSISNEVTEISGDQIEKYMIEREGVFTCEINVKDKLIVLEVNASADDQLMLQLVRYAEHLYVVHRD